ncbi:hypothetical protein [Ferruginibacter sp.]
MNPPKLTPLQALPRAKHYCSYQERSHSDVKDKLYGFGLNKAEVEQNHQHIDRRELPE